MEVNGGLLAQENSSGMRLRGPHGRSQYGDEEKILYLRVESTPNFLFSGPFVFTLPY